MKKNTQEKILQNQKKSVTQGQKLKNKEVLQENPRAQLLTKWSEDIEALLGQKFQTVDEACDALVDRVTQRMSGNPNASEEMRQFLKELFQLDPSLRAEVKSLLHIRE